MFDSLSEKLQMTLSEVRGRGTLTEEDISAAMREIRLALLEADVNFKVVKSFTGAVKERALGAGVIGQLNPGQQVVKIVSDELTELMGGAARDLSFSPRPPTVVLMAELANIKKATKPHDVLLVVDAMTGQDAVNVAEQFAEVVQFDGVVMTKLDGDARGGAALSVKAVTGKPILFASTGEKLDQFERFHPDRMAQRILGMGDGMTLIEKAEGAYDEEQAAELERKLRKQEFGLDDFLEQLRQVRRLGPLQSLLGMIPGMGKELRGVRVDEREFDRLQAIILSMTPYERRHPETINGSRRLRIARGSGTNVQAVKQLIKQFEQVRKVMRQVAQGRMPDLGALMRMGR